MRKENKSALIEQIKGYLNEYPHFYLVDLAGMNAEKTANLRRLCNKGGIKLLMVKNTLLRRAMSEVDVDLAPLYTYLKGNTAIMLTQVANAPAKLIKDLSKDKKADNKISLKGAYAETGFYGPDQLEALVGIKSKEELVADVLALLQSPIRNVLSALENKDAANAEGEAAAV